MGKLRLNRSVFALALLSSATAPALGGELVDELTTAQDAALLQVMAEAVDEQASTDGSMPAFTVRISGKVQLGSNPCLAAGLTASLTSQRFGGVVEVRAIVSSPQPEGPRICTREFAPVFADVQTTVRGNALLYTKDVVVKNAGSFGADVSAFELIGRSDLVVTDFESQEFVNPEAFSVQIAATVMIGANPCRAKVTDVKFISQTKGDVVYVRAVHRSKPGGPRICTMEYSPVFERISTTISGRRSEVSRIVLLNVDEKGRQVDVAHF